MTNSETVADAVALSRWEGEGGAGAPKAAKRAFSNSVVSPPDRSHREPGSLPAAIVSVFNLQTSKIVPATRAGDAMGKMKQ